MNIDVNKVIFGMGPRGAGKNHQFNELLTKYPEYFTQALSVKSRGPRSNEKLGIDYIQMPAEYFLSPENEELFLESNVHKDYSGALYGTRHEEIIRALQTGKHALKEMEPEGFRKALIKGIPYNFSGFYLDIPDDIIEKRALLRDPHTPKMDIEQGIMKAQKERVQFGDLIIDFPQADLVRVDGNRSIAEVTRTLLEITGVSKYL